MNIINLRGANGSGKTFLLRQWMLHHEAQPHPRRINLLGGTSQFKAPEYYLLNDGGCVVGDYTNACGGCDAIDKQDIIRTRVMRCGQTAKYVLFEGVIVSTIFASYLQFSKAVGGMTWVYLDTPLEVCLKRIYGRNNGEPIKERLVADKIKNIDSTRRKALASGQRVVTLHWERAAEDFSKLMRSFG